MLNLRIATFIALIITSPSATFCEQPPSKAEQEHYIRIKPWGATAVKQLTELGEEAEKTLRGLAQAKEQSELVMQKLAKKMNAVITDFNKKTQEDRNEKGLTHGPTYAKKDWFIATGENPDASEDSPSGPGNEFEKLLQRMQGKIDFNIQDKIISPTQTLADFVAEDATEARMKSDAQLFVDLLSPENPKREEYRRWGSQPTRAMILTGPSGIGKTHLLKCMAGELAQKSNIPCIEITGSDLISKDGESGRNATELFKKINTYADECGLQKVVVIVDEIDEMLRSRQVSNSAEIESIGYAFLRGLDGLTKKDNIILLGSTNLTSLIDPAVRDRCTIRAMYLPSEKSREKHLFNELKKRIDAEILNDTVAQKAAQIIARNTARNSYRDLDRVITQLCNRAANSGQTQLTSEWVSKQWPKPAAPGLLQRAWRFASTPGPVILSKRTSGPADFSEYIGSPKKTDDQDEGNDNDDDND